MPRGAEDGAGEVLPDMVRGKERGDDNTEFTEDAEIAEKRKAREIPRSADSARNDNFSHAAKMGSSGARPLQGRTQEHSQE